MALDLINLALTEKKYIQSRVPGKVFLVGEYLSNYGGGAIVSAVGSEFILNGHQNQSEYADSKMPFHPKSPAGQILESISIKDWNFQWIDPYCGAGGLGGSTAEFVAAYSLNASVKDVTTVSREYRTLFENLPEHQMPSGYDLVTQLRGGLVYYRSKKDKLIDLDFEWLRDHIKFYRATDSLGRKVDTHTHLGSWTGFHVAEIDRLNSISESALSSCINQDLDWFAFQLEEYRQALAKLGLESEDSKIDSNIFRSAEGVLAVKGCGAMLSDVILVVADFKDLERWRYVDAIAYDRGLVPIDQSLLFVRGASVKVNT